VSPGDVVSIKDPSDDTKEIAKVTVNADGTLTVEPIGDYVGPISFDYTAADPSGASSTGTATLNVGGAAPLANPDENTVLQDETLEVSAADGVIQSTSESSGRDVDPDGNAMEVSAVSYTNEEGDVTFAQVGQPLEGAYGTLTLNADGSYTYVPNEASKALGEQEGGQDVFSYSLVDSTGLITSTTLSISVQGTNDAPVVQDDLAATKSGESVTVDVLANDFDPDSDDSLTITDIPSMQVALRSTFTIQKTSMWSLPGFRLWKASWWSHPWAITKAPCLSAIRSKTVQKQLAQAW
jgi:VCBS repeat-containing protein